MKKKILICTIMRNQENNIMRWYNQLDRLIKWCPDYEFTVSVYENDSTDETKNILSVIEKNGEISIILKCENLGTAQYGSIWSTDRLKNLAIYRQKAIDQVGHLNFDKIAFIEPDVSYDPRWCSELINAVHPAQAGLVPHIYSAWSLRSEKHPKESCFLYDTCATRQTKYDTCWEFGKENLWRGKSLVKTHITDIDSNCLHQIWSTFNCFCVYDAEPFKKGIKWGYLNKRLNNGQPYINDGDYGSGFLEADTVMICESFREAGYNNIYLNTNCLTRHE